jgi:integrase
VARFLPVADAFSIIVGLNRELELNRSFVKDDTGCWCIKHRPDDYKTGKTYGERPPLQLGASLTPAIDDFLLRWRPCLRPVGDQFFVQPRTGNPLTHDSVYQIVGRSCYQYTGKRTNPHLLRDMIVTHVRESSNASEKELEALALFMGHSVHMQRTSYDRRTLNQKVAPAVQLMESVNAKLSLK